MPDTSEQPSLKSTSHKARFTGPKPPLKPKQVWAIRIRLQMAKRVRSHSRAWDHRSHSGIGVSVAAAFDDVTPEPRGRKVRWLTVIDRARNETGSIFLFGQMGGCGEGVR